MKKIKIEFTNERIIPASGLAVVGAIIGKCDFVKRCNRMDVTPDRSQHQIKNGDVLLTSDIDVERLPSGRFEINELVLELTVLVHNILRMTGQESIGRKGTETKYKVRRRRLRTVIGNMIMMASHVTEHACQLLIGLGRGNIWRHVFAEVYAAFADFQL